MSPTAFHPPHMSRLAAIDHRYINKRPPPVGTDVPRTLPFLRTPSLDWNTFHPRSMNAKPWTFDLLELSRRSHLCNDLSLRNSDAVQLFFDISIWKKNESIPELQTQKVGSLWDVIQGFAQKLLSHIRRAHNAAR